jgi:hypothetical protein
MGWKRIPMIPPMVNNVAMVSVGCLKTVTITQGAKVIKTGLSLD